MGERLGERPGRVQRAAEAVRDILSVRIHAWSELPASLDLEVEKPVAAIVEYPHGLQLCDPPELGWQTVEGVGIPPRTDGTSPRAA